MSGVIEFSAQRFALDGTTASPCDEDGLPPRARSPHQ
jgi:hypothetical protein